MSALAFDSWALLAWLIGQEPAATSVRKFLESAEEGRQPIVMSTMNAVEVYYVLAKRHGRDKALQFRERLPALPIRLATPAEHEIWAVADLKSAYAISYADAFAAELAIRLDCPLVTGAPELRSIRNLKIHWLT